MLIYIITKSLPFIYCFYSLKDTLLGFLERQGLPEFKELEHLPDDVLMCHVASTWKEIVLHQSKIEK